MPDDTSNFAGDPNAPHGPAPYGPAAHGPAPCGPAPYGPGQVEKTHRFLRFLYLSQVPIILVPLALAALPGGIGSKGGVFVYVMSVLAPIMVFFQALIWIATYIRADAAGVRIVSKAVASLLCLYYASALLCGLAMFDTGDSSQDRWNGHFEPSILKRLGVDGRFSSRLAILSFLAGAAFLLVTTVVAMASNPLPKELRFQRRKPQWQEGPQMRQEEL